MFLGDCFFCFLFVFDPRLLVVQQIPLVAPNEASQMIPIHGFLKTLGRCRVSLKSKNEDGSKPQTPCLGAQEDQIMVEPVNFGGSKFPACALCFWNFTLSF